MGRARQTHSVGCRDSRLGGVGVGVPDGNRRSLGSQSRPGRKGQQLLLAEVGRVNSVKVEGLTVML